MYVSINNYLTILILVETFYIELLLYKPFFSRVKTKQKTESTMRKTNKLKSKIYFCAILIENT